MPGYSGDLKMKGGKKNHNTSKKNQSNNNASKKNQSNNNDSKKNHSGGKKNQPKIHQGPRGGKYIIKNGNKQYIKS